MSLAQELGCLQIDPIRVVEHPHLLITFSRLGPYDRAEMDKALWEERRLFHYWAHAASLVPTSDYPIHQVMMRRYPSMTSVRHERLVEFLEHNKALRRHILVQLRRKGPLRTSDFSDIAVKNFESDGWNTNRNVDRMLDYLWTKGKVMITGRAGLQRIWDLAERWFPDWTPRKTLTVQSSTRVATERSIRALGIANPRQINQYFTRWRYEDLPGTLKQLEAKKRIVPATIPDLKGRFYVHVDDLELVDALERSEWKPRTTLLSPFDPLIADRIRTSQLWGFDYTIEIYVPKTKRKFGYYVLPILHGDRLVGRMDTVMDRKTDRLVVKGLWAESTAPRDRITGAAVGTAIEELAAWLGATVVDYPRKQPAGWKEALG